MPQKAFKKKKREKKRENNVKSSRQVSFHIEFIEINFPF